MVGIVVIGTVPVFLNPTILSATTVSGAMVFGLAPVFCLWRTEVGRAGFYLPVGFGLLCGTIFALGYWPTTWVVTTGNYADLLSVSLVESVGCFALYGLSLLLFPKTRHPAAAPAS